MLFQQVTADPDIRRAINLNFSRLSVIERGLRPVMRRQYHRIPIYGSKTSTQSSTLGVALGYARWSRTCCVAPLANDSLVSVITSPALKAGATARAGRADATFNRKRRPNNRVVGHDHRSWTPDICHPAGPQFGDTCGQCGSRRAEGLTTCQDGLEWFGPLRRNPRDAGRWPRICPSSRRPNRFSCRRGLLRSEVSLPPKTRLCSISSQTQRQRRYETFDDKPRLLIATTTAMQVPLYEGIVAIDNSSHVIHGSAK